MLASFKKGMVGGVKVHADRLQVVFWVHTFLWSGRLVRRHRCVSVCSVEGFILHLPSASCCRVLFLCCLRSDAETVAMVSQAECETLVAHLGPRFCIRGSRVQRGKDTCCVTVTVGVWAHAAVGSGASALFPSPQRQPAWTRSPFPSEFLRIVLEAPESRALCGPCWPHGLSARPSPANHALCFPDAR